jgi:transposase
MLNLGTDIKIYLCSGYTDMRKGINGLTVLAGSLLSNQFSSGAMFVFRGRSGDRIKILWFDGQGFCLFYKCLERGRFIWPKSEDTGTVGITRAQLAMLLEGIDWRTPKWSQAPVYAG